MLPGKVPDWHFLGMALAIRAMLKGWNSDKSWTGVSATLPPLSPSQHGSGIIRERDVLKLGGIHDKNCRTGTRTVTTLR